VSVRFCVLGSGSRGNAVLVTSPGANVLIDPGFAPAEIERRMKGTGARWERLDAVVLTHTHGDHFKKSCLRPVVELGIPFFCHHDHAATVREGRYRKRIEESGVLRTYGGAPFEVGGEFLFHPLPLPHDAPPTFGFRIEGADGGGRVRRIGYLCDLGHWTETMVAFLQCVDLLALEFNHDEVLQRGSGRHPRLIARVLGAQGHLSNTQAAGLLGRIFETCGGGGPKRIVQMHLSGECNTPELAYRAAMGVVRKRGVSSAVYSSRQDRRGRVLEV